MNIDFLIEMAWKSALISGGALAFAALLRSRSADERAAVLRAAFALILALPLLSLLLPALPVVAFAAPEAAPLPAYLPAADPALSALAEAAPAEAAAEPLVRDDPTALILLAWLGGVAMVGLRLLAGLWTLRRWTRSASEVDCPAWRQAFEAALPPAGPARRVRLLAADVPSPLGWGWLNPVILVDRDTIRQPGEADAVLAHELAHVERRDWLVLILARIAVALLWFNPLMWLLERHLVEEAEQAADARALTRVEPARYAQTLLSCARSYPGLPATGIADTGLARRVKAVLDGGLERAASPRRARLAMLLCVLAAAPVAALKPVAAAPEAPLAPAAPEAPPAPPATPAPAAVAVPPAPGAPAAPAALPTALSPLAALAPVAPPAPPLAPGAAPVAPGTPRALAMMHPHGPPAPHAPPAPPARRGGDDDDEDQDYDVDFDPEDSAEMSREIAEAMAEAREDIAEAARRSARISAHARAAAADAARNSSRIAAHAREAARRGIAAGAAGMAEGARGMEQGARGMEAEADRLRSPEHRAAEIARAAKRGETVTDRELLDLIPKLREGARGLRRGAEAMRREAEKMRD